MRHYVILSEKSSIGNESYFTRHFVKGEKQGNDIPELIFSYTATYNQMAKTLEKDWEEIGPFFLSWSIDEIVFGGVGKISCFFFGSEGVCQNKFSYEIKGDD